nr:hypothetical protein BaRGS_008470 [Batillaria attramentaria]KAG5702028.1 hypothetical protein BaRGS_015763 [Batillaria attramentaria]KAG5707793.1 hypothetical protein BaRGS_015953 [Batillaria attramentaria]KAG5714115.1 hypothetical protein BaRGS_020443 [Batillaria attramentaria]
MFDVTKKGESAVKDKTKELCLLDNFDGRAINRKIGFGKDPMDFEWSMTVEIPKQKKGAGELFYKGVEISRGDTFGRRQINAAHRDRLM